MNWDSRAAANLLPLSVEKENLGTALKEWFYTEEMVYSEEAVGTCELCDRPNIRYQFLIGNLHTKKGLFIGSECIEKFKIYVIDPTGKRKPFLMDTAEKRIIIAKNAQQPKEKVKRDRRRLISAAKEKDVISSLIALDRSDAEFESDYFIEYYRARKAFPPDQLVSLILRLDKNKIEYEISSFRMTIQRSEEQEQLRKMEEWKIEKIWKCMSPGQRNFHTKLALVTCPH